MWQVTLLNILGLLDNTNSGEYYFDGNEVPDYFENQRTKVRKATSVCISKL
jgi:putative ABC transport system ATP-binding protein